MTNPNHPAPKTEGERIAALRWHKQTRLHDPENGMQGNCTQAAVASLLGLELSEVPDFNELHKNASDFWDAIHQFFRDRGFDLVCIRSNYGSEALHLASGKSPRGTNHMVVRRGQHVVSDPHPSDAGLLTVERVYVAVPLDPATLTAQLAKRDARIARLEEALHPFADESKFWTPSDFNDEHRPFSGDITIGHFRRARAALSTNDEIKFSPTRPPND